MITFQEISLESTIRLTWFDKRIKAKLNKSLDENYVIINRNPVDHFWFPDIFISKAKELRKPFYKIPPSYLRIHDDGKMVYSARVNFDLSCPMDFSKYPVSILFNNFDNILFLNNRVKKLFCLNYNNSICSCLG